MWTGTQRGESGFTLIEMMMIVTVIGIVAAMAAPGMANITSELRLGQGVREVEREMQTARLKAVTSNRPIRVRFNCPEDGKYRMVELVGSPSSPQSADDPTSKSRCGESAYPFPAADQNPLTRPNHDGPTRTLPKDVSFGGVSDLEFWPDGSVHYYTAGAVPWPLVGTSGKAIMLVKSNKVKSISVNGLGKITLNR